MSDFPPQLSEQLKQVKQRVAYILDKKPACRGNDALLVWHYHYYFDGWNKFVRPEQFYEMYKTLVESTSPETVTRCRRKLNELGLYLPLFKTQLKRRVRESAMREQINEV